MKRMRDVNPLSQPVRFANEFSSARRSPSRMQTTPGKSLTTSLKRKRRALNDMYVLTTSLKRKRMGIELYVFSNALRLRFRLVSSVPADSDGKSGDPIRHYRTNSPLATHSPLPLATRHYFLASPTMWGSSGRMILVMASSTAAREPGMTRIGTLPISPPTARLRMQAGPIWA